MTTTIYFDEMPTQQNARGNSERQFFYLPNIFRDIQGKLDNFFNI